MHLVLWTIVRNHVQVVNVHQGDTEGVEATLALLALLHAILQDVMHLVLWIIIHDHVQAANVQEEDHTVQDSKEVFSVIHQNAMLHAPWTTIRSHAQVVNVPAKLKQSVFSVLLRYVKLHATLHMAAYALVANALQF